MGWLLLHFAVRSAAISVDSVWLSLDSLSKRRLTTVAAGQLIDTTSVFKESWHRHCRNLLGQRLLRSCQHTCVDSSELPVVAERLKCCHIFRAIPQTATPMQVTQEERSMSVLRQSLIDSMLSIPPEFCGLTYRIDTCWILPNHQPEVLMHALDTLSLEEWSEPLVTPMGIHLLKILVRDTYLERKKIMVEDSLLEHLKSKHVYRPQLELQQRLFKGEMPEGVLFYLKSRAYTMSLYQLFAASCNLSPRNCFAAFLKKSLMDAEALELFSDAESGKRLAFSRDSLMIHHLLLRVVEPRLHDEAALEAWYQAHSNLFQRPTFIGLVLHCVDKKQGRALRRFLKRIPEAEWRHALKQVFAGQPAEAPEVDEGVFFEGVNPYVDALLFHGQSVEPHPERPYIQLVGRKVKGPENYQEVRQEVINHYQLELINQLLTFSEVVGNVEN